MMNEKARIGSALLAALVCTAGCDGTRISLEIKGPNIIADQLRIRAEQGGKQVSEKLLPEQTSPMPIVLPLSIVSSFSSITDEVVFDVDAFSMGRLLSSARSQPVKLDPGKLVAAEVELAAGSSPPPDDPMPSDGGAPPDPPNGGTAPVLASLKSVYSVGEPITLSFANGPGNQRDWIAVDRPGGPLFLWSYCGSAQPPRTPHTPTAALRSGTITLDAAALNPPADGGAPTWPLPAGTYTASFRANDTYMSLATTMFTVQ